MIYIIYMYLNAQLFAYRLVPTPLVLGAIIT